MVVDPGMAMPRKNQSTRTRARSHQREKRHRRLWFPPGRLPRSKPLQRPFLSSATHVVSHLPLPVTATAEGTSCPVVVMLISMQEPRRAPIGMTGPGEAAVMGDGEELRQRFERDAMPLLPSLFAAALR